MSDGASPRPRIWLVLGDKVGDNRQVERVAEALTATTGEPFEVRRLTFRPRWREGKPPFLPSLYHVDRGASDALAAPWPDLVLTVGRRPAMAALWIRRRSGNRTRIVLFGRPKRFFDDFALLVAPAQYGLPDRPNVLRLGLPLIRLDPGRVAAEAEHWRDELAGLPRPLTVLLVGGRTKPFRMDAGVARDLLARTLADAPAGGGLFVSTSRRTPAAVVEALRAELPEGARLHTFTPGGVENPYLGLLGLGDRFVVTGDSVSMLTEIARLRRPLVIYPLPVDDDRRRRWQDALAAWAPTRRLVDRVRETGLLGWPRDLGALHDLLVERGAARRFGEAPVESAAAPDDELDRVVARVRALLAAPVDGPGPTRETLTTTAPAPTPETPPQPAPQRGEAPPMEDWNTRLRRGIERTGAILLPDATRVRVERRIRGALEARRLDTADAVVVSFGKSGRTWLRVMLSHFYKVRHGLTTEMLIEFDNMHRLDRGIPRLMFTHDNYLGDWTGNGASKADYGGRRVALLVRHPADTAVSQYHQWRHRMRPHKKLLNQYPPEGEDVGLFDFVMDARGGLPRIVEFMNQWAAALPTLADAVVVRYEDLRTDTARELHRVLEFLGTPGDAKAIQDAVDFASFERMRARESAGTETAGAGARLTATDRSNPDSFKTRRAKVGGFRDDFEPAQIEAIERYIDAHLEPRFGYGTDAGAAARVPQSGGGRSAEAARAETASQERPTP